MQAGVQVPLLPDARAGTTAQAHGRLLPKGLQSRVGSPFHRMDGGAQEHHLRPDQRHAHPMEANG